MPKIGGWEINYISVLGRFSSLVSSKHDSKKSARLNLCAPTHPEACKWYVKIRQFLKWRRKSMYVVQCPPLNTQVEVDCWTRDCYRTPANSFDAADYTCKFHPSSDLLIAKSADKFLHGQKLGSKLMWNLIPISNISVRSSWQGQRQCELNRN